MQNNDISVLFLIPDVCLNYCPDMVRILSKYVTVCFTKYLIPGLVIENIYFILFLDLS